MEYLRTPAAPKTEYSTSQFQNMLQILFAEVLVRLKDENTAVTMTGRRLAAK